jgi:tyrosyl-tRNA synthetase
MSASDPDSKIDVLDNADIVKRKLKKAHAVPKVTDDNGILSFVEYVLLPASYLKYGEPKFVVERRDAEPLVYKNISEMKEDYTKDILSPQDLKPAVTAALNTLLEPVQAEFQANKEWQEIEQKAYPPPPEKKKEKKKKDKGAFHPGAKKQVEAKPDGHVEGKDKASVDVGTESGEKTIEDLTLEDKK